MFGICIESSHSRGMGHLFRTLNFISLLKEKHEDYIVFVNDDPAARKILNGHNIPFETVNLNDHHSNWELEVIKCYNISVWLNDRLNTTLEHAKNVKNTGILLVTMDDSGPGASKSDIHFAGLVFTQEHELQGADVFIGKDYLILNKEIALYRRKRTATNKLLISMGGSDTYGVTLKILEIVREAALKATVITGPSFAHMSQLNKMTDSRHTIKQSVPSLIKEFYQYDMAITGGGITPFEANASGLPCIIVANEYHEIPSARYLHNVGSSIFAGHHTEIDHSPFKVLHNISAAEMSTAGLSHFHLKGVSNIYEKIKELQKHD